MPELTKWVAQSGHHHAWDRYLDAWPRHEVFAKPTYLNLYLEEHQSAVCLHFAHDAGELIYPLIVRGLDELDFVKGPLAEHRDLVTAPFGTGGPYVRYAEDEVRLVRAFYAAYEGWCHDEKVIAEYTTFPPVEPRTVGYPGDVAERMPVVVKPLQGRDVLADMNATKRNEVRQAMAKGVTVDVDVDGAEIEGFVDAYVDTKRRQTGFHDGLDMSTQGVRRLINALTPDIVLFHARHGDRVIASALVLCSGTSLIYHRAGSLSETMRLRGAQLLLFSISAWGRDHGYERLLIGGGTASDPQGPLFRYKASFTRQPAVPLFVGRWVVDRPAYAAVNEARTRYDAQAPDVDPRNGFFPAYRAPLMRPHQ